MSDKQLIVLVISLAGALLVSEQSVHDTLKIRTDVERCTAFEGSSFDSVVFCHHRALELAALYPSAASAKTSINSDSKTQLDIDAAVPPGLILNELISNAYKYAFEGDPAGKLTVSVASLGDGRHQLTVTDTGAGLPQAFDFAKAKSLGLRLVRRLAKQLYGSVDYRWEDGACFVVSFSDTQLRKAV